MTSLASRAPTSPPETGASSACRPLVAAASEILRASEAQGFAPPRHRVSLPKSRLLSLVLRQGLFG